MRGHHDPIGWAATMLIAVADAHVLLELAAAVLAVAVAVRLLPRDGIDGTPLRPVKEKLMPNPVTATHDQAEHASRPPDLSAPDPGQARFAPLFTRAVRLGSRSLRSRMSLAGR